MLLTHRPVFSPTSLLHRTLHYNTPPSQAIQPHNRDSPITHSTHLTHRPKKEKTTRSPPYIFPTAACTFVFNFIHSIQSRESKSPFLHETSLFQKNNPSPRRKRSKSITLPSLTFSHRASAATPPSSHRMNLTSSLNTFKKNSKFVLKKKSSPPSDDHSLSLNFSPLTRYIAYDTLTKSLKTMDAKPPPFPPLSVL